MLDSIYTALTAGGASTLSSILTCYIMRYIFKREEAERTRTEIALAEAQERRLAAMEHDIAELSGAFGRHIREDRTQELLTVMRNLERTTGDLSANILNVIRADAAQRAQIEALTTNVADLRDDLKDHMDRCNR